MEPTRAQRGSARGPVVLWDYGTIGTEGSFVVVTVFSGLSVPLQHRKRSTPAPKAFRSSTESVPLQHPTIGGYLPCFFAAHRAAWTLR